MTKMPVLALIASAFLLPTPAAAADDALNLVCFGVGEKLTTRNSSELVWDKYDHRYRSRDSISTGMEQMDTAVTIQIYGGDGRIRLPKALVPPINAGGDDQHWWQLTDLVTTSDQIEAKYKLNGLNHPRLRIDRTTGEIVIKGFGQDFHGRCDPVDPGQRRF